MLQILHTPIAQQMAEALSNIIGVEVEVMDENLSMVAGTADICKKLEKRINSFNYISSKVVDNKEILIVNNPGYHDLCATCKVINKCSVTGKMFYPLINSRRETEGVVVLASKNKTQYKFLIEKKEALIMFLDNITSLASLKTNARNSDSFIRHQLQVVINAFNDGFILLDEHGNVNQINEAAAEIIGLPGGKVIGKDLKKLINEKRINDILREGKFDKHKFFIKNDWGNSEHIICNTLPINYNNEYRGAVFTLRTLKEGASKNSEIAPKKTNTYLTAFLGVSQKIRHIKEQAQKVALSDSTVLITGESGTGKELLARAIHQESKRENNSFIAINCSAIPDNLLESELFGYEEGAFTGAKKGGKLGKFQLAHEGTIFLDEIGDMSLSLQAKLLRVLEDQVIEPIGSTKQILIDIRVIAATNRNLEDMIAKNQFRSDLFYRINVIPIFIPPLRERPEDIPELITHFLSKHCQALGKNIVDIEDNIMDILKNYHWPGNVRELSNVIEYAVNMEDSKILRGNSLPPYIGLRLEKMFTGKHELMSIKEIEKEAVLHALNLYGRTTSGKASAAKALGIDLTTLYRKLKEYKIG